MKLFRLVAENYVPKAVSVICDKTFVWIGNVRVYQRPCDKRNQKNVRKRSVLAEIGRIPRTMKTAKLVSDKTVMQLILCTRYI